MSSVADDDKLNTLKTEVRCTLISTKEGLSLKDFLRDYKETVGKPFPFIPYGYKTPLEFLRSMPDVVSIIKPCGSPELLVPVEDEKSAHIHKLTLGQKRSTKKGFTRPRPVQLPKDTYNTPRLIPKLPPPQRSSTPVRGWESTRLAPNYQAVPRESYSSGWNGFNQSMAMPQMPANDHYYQPQPLMSINATNPSTGQGSLNISSTSTQHPVKMITHNVIDITKLFSNTKQESEVVENIAAAESSLPVQNDVVAGICGPTQEVNGQVEDDDTPPNGLNNERLLSEDEDDNLEINDRMKDNFRLILNEHPNGILASKFPIAYQKKYGVPLNQNDLGFQSIKELVTCCSDVFKIHKLKNPKDWLLFDASSAAVPEDDCSKWIPDYIIDNMQALSEKFPLGLNSNELLDKYEEYFESPLDYKKLGFESLTSFLVNCSSVECKTLDDFCMIYPIIKDTVDVLAPELDDSAQDSLLSFENAEFLWKQFFEEYVCDPKFKYTDFKLPEDDVMKVLVCDAISPDTMWLQNAVTGNLLGDLMFELNNFYDDEEDNFKMNDKMIMPNVACCVKYEPVNRWHRGLIHPPIDSEEVKVVYIDFGTTSFVKKSELRTLHRKFAELPIQSIKTKLYGIKPANQNGWSEEVKGYFFQLVLENVFVAQVMKFHPETQTIEVILCDTSGPEDVIVNDKLVEKKYAHSTLNPPTGMDLTLNENKESPVDNCQRINPPEKRQPKKRDINVDISNNYPECFLKLLPPWLGITKDWSLVLELLEQAKNAYSKDEKSHTKKNYPGVPPSCCTHHLLTHLLVNKPKVICDSWTKTINAMNHDIERMFLKNISSKLKMPLNLKNGTRLCFSGVNKHNIPPTDEREVKIKVEPSDNDNSGLNSNQDTDKFELAAIDKNNYVTSVGENERHRISSNTDSSAVKKELSTCHQSQHKANKEHIIDNNVKIKILKVRIHDGFVHCIRYNDNVYVLMNQIKKLFGNSIPQNLWSHRILLDKKFKYKDEIIAPSDPNLHKELLAQHVINRSDIVSLIPLSLAGDAVHQIDRLQKPLADAFKRLADMCKLNASVWYE